MTKRDQLFKWIFDKSDGQQYRPVDLKGFLPNGDWTENDLGKASDYFAGEGLVEQKDDSGLLVWLTHRGIEFGENSTGSELSRDELLRPAASNQKNRPAIFETMSDTYEVLGLLGQGGVGVVYDVRDSSGRTFALKILSEAVVSSEKIRRFRNELRFLARNDHPNLVSIIDEGFVLRDRMKIPFYVMPKYDSTLRRLIVDGIPPEKIMQYFRDLLAGVEFLHSKDIYHRDMKPENVLYDAQTDRLLIADLGAAHFAEEELHTLVETKPGTRLANFQYAAPEQRERGKSVTYSADLFALGAILNEMFTKSIPAGEEYPKISEVNGTFAPLDSVVARLIRHRPENRYQSVNEVREALGELSPAGPSVEISETESVTQSLESPNGPDDSKNKQTKTAFEKALEEVDQLRGEQAFQQQKAAFFRSQEGADAAFNAFGSLIAMAENNLSLLRQKDPSFQIEVSQNRRAFVVKSTGFSISFAIETNHTSVGAEYLLFDKRWKGSLSLNPNAIYFDPEWKPKIIDEVVYTADVNGSYRVCWLNPKKKSQHSSDELVDQSLSWLVKQAIDLKRKGQY